MRPTVANDKKHGIYPKQSINPKQSRNSLTQSKPHEGIPISRYHPKPMQTFDLVTSSLSW